MLDLPRGVQAHAVGELDLLQGVLDQAVLAVVAPRARDLVLVEDPEAHVREPNHARFAAAGSARLGSGAAPTSPSPGVRMSRCARSLPLAALVAALCLAPTSAGAAPPATDGPGALSHFDLARKDCVGTARNTTSKVWFTVANGVLSDVYFPTNDNTNVETLQYIVSDGSSFTDLQTRDTTYTVQATDDRALTCRVTTTAKSGRYKIVTDYTTDPWRPTVLIRSRFVALKGRLSDYRLYVRHDPTLNGNGGGGTTPATAAPTTAPWPRPAVTRCSSARTSSPRPTPPTATTRSPCTRRSTSAAASTRRPTASPAQASDGLVQLDASHALTDLHDSAMHGNLVQVGRVPLGHHGRFTLALGYGDTQAGAISASQRSLQHGFDARPPRLRAQLERLRRAPRQAAPAARRLGPALERHPRRVLPERQLREGGRGQDVPRRRGGIADLAVGPGGLGRRPGQHLLRLLPRGLRARPLRSVDRGLPGR